MFGKEGPTVDRERPVPVSRPQDVNLTVKPIEVNVTVTHVFAALLETRLEEIANLIKQSQADKDAIIRATNELRTHTQSLKDAASAAKTGTP
jgi:hypothetical protein